MLESLTTPKRRPDPLKQALTLLEWAVELDEQGVALDHQERDDLRQQSKELLWKLRR